MFTQIKLINGKLKKYFLLFLFILLNNFIFAISDSTRVTFCTSYGDDCHGIPTYGESIDLLDSLNRTIQTTVSFRSGCEYMREDEDSIFRIYSINQYLYDVNSNVISDTLTIFHTPDSIQDVYTYTYDNLNHLLSKLIKRLLPLPTYDLFSQSYEYLNDSITTFIQMQWDGSSLDTTIYNLTSYDSLMRKTNQISYSYNSFLLRGKYETNWIYDSLGNLSMAIYSNQLPGIDSSRTIYYYDSLNNLSSTIFQNYSYTTSLWKSSNRQLYTYNNLQQLILLYYLNCPDSTCSDSLGQADFTYDISGRLNLIDNHDYFGGWGGSTSCYYNSNGDTILFGGGSPTENGCGTSSYTYYFYNASEQRDSSHVGALSACANQYNDCNYYNLNQDSMVLKVEYPITACPYTKVYPVVFSEGGKPPYQYHWSPGIEFSDSTIKYPFVLPLTSSIYTLTVIDALGHSVSDTFAVNMFPNQIHPVTIQAIGNPPCNGNVILSFPSDSLLGQWYFYWTSDGSYYYSDSLIAYYSGNYQLSIYNQNCMYSSDTDLVLIVPQPLVINSVGSTYNCTGDSIILFTSATTNFTWNTGETSDTISVYDTGNYYITLIDSNACPDTSNQIGIHISDPQTKLLNDTSFCSGQFIHFTLPGQNYIFLWTDNSYHSYLDINQPGNYFIEIRDNYGCQIYDTITVSENQLPLVDLGRDTLLCQNQSIVLNSGSYSNYLWNDGSSNSSLLSAYTGIDTVTYFVSVTDTNHCSNSDSINVFYDVCAQIKSIELPNITFSPSPADHEIKIELPNDQGELTIFNGESKIVFQELKQQHLIISTSNWSSGNYIYQWKYGKNKIQGKFSVIH